MSLQLEIGLLRARSVSTSTSRLQLLCTNLRATLRRLVTLSMTTLVLLLANSSCGWKRDDFRRLNTPGLVINPRAVYQACLMSALRLIVGARDRWKGSCSEGACSAQVARRVGSRMRGGALPNKLRFVGPLAMVAAVLVACGQASTPAPPSGNGSLADGRDMSGRECLLGTSEVERATGWTISRSKATGGYKGAVGGTDVEMVWTGCRYLTAENGAISVGTLIGENDEPDVSGFEALLKMAAEPGDRPAPEVGEDAFYGGNEQLFVRTETSTFNLSFFGSTPALHNALESIAKATVEAGDPPDCGVLEALIPTKYDASAEVGGGLETCTVAVTVDGQRETAALIYMSGTETFESTKEVEMGDPVRVTDVGDSAVAYKSELLFRSGDRAYVVSGEGADEEPVAADVLVKLARAVVSSHP